VSIGGIAGGAGGASPYAPRPLGPGNAAAEQNIRERAATPAKAQPAPATVTTDENAVPLEAPPGTDPAFWSVLTAEERRYFAKMQALGPLTYGPRPATAPPTLARGVRIDMTV
jgi:hypothetical protein